MVSNNMMDYFNFNDEDKEVCFSRYDMPTPWMNYLSNGVFHTMISQAGGGLVFYRSPQIWRINRYRFFHLPTDRSGPYIYIQDAGTGDYWCPTNEPALLKPERWKSAHGMGYTRFEAERDGIYAQLTYFVGPFEDSLIWELKLRNVSGREKKINLYAFVEFGMMEFMRELQWQCYNKHQVSVSHIEDCGALVYNYGVENQPKPGETPLVYFAADRKPVAYDGDRDEFIGSYRSETNPYAIENKGCTNSTLMGGDPCGALQFTFAIKPGQDECINVFLGTAMTMEAVIASITRSRETGFVKKSFSALKKNWSGYLESFVCNIPDEKAQRMVNIWNPYQAQRNFLFSRNISYYATGTFRGVGYRDTSQDIISQVALDIEGSKDKIEMLFKEQYNDGHVNHYFFPVEGWSPVTSIHSDDHLWLALAVWEVVMESGDLSYLDKKVSYFDGGEGTVYEHLCKSIEFTKSNLGSNGFPLMLRSDWNDQLFRVCRKGKGESIWTSMQLGTVLLKMIDLASLSGRKEDATDFRKMYEEQKTLVNSIAWDGKWFRRAIMDDGRFLGTDGNDQAKIWLNTQTWAVISGMADKEKALTAMDSVREMLDTDLGIKKLYPPITTFPDPEDPLTNYNPGTGENGAVFCHANTWAVIAECILGRGDRAYKYYRQLIPEVAMEKAGLWRYKAEPYVYSSNLFGPESDKFGLANVSWLTGTAAWMYVAATQYILGIKPVWEGLKIEPCMPDAWSNIKVRRKFRGCTYNIEIFRAFDGTSRIEVNGNMQEENVIKNIYGRDNIEVKVYIGQR